MSVSRADRLLPAQLRRIERAFEPAFDKDYEVLIVDSTITVEVLVRRFGTCIIIADGSFFDMIFLLLSKSLPNRFACPHLNVEQPLVLHYNTTVL